MLVSQQTVQRCCPLAAQAGIIPGMPLALAQGQLPHAQIYEFDPIRSLKALHGLARWALKFSPLVAVDQDRILHENKEKNFQSNGITLNVSGLERVQNGITTLANTILKELAAHGIQAVVGIAPTIGAAWAFSRYGADPVNVVERKFLKAALSLLPVRALRIRNTTVQALHQLGVISLGQLLKLPSHTLGSRFGAELPSRLCQALGSIEETLTSVQPLRTFEVREEFEPPLQHHRALAQAILALFQKLLKKLHLESKKANSFTLELQEVCYVAQSTNTAGNAHKQTRTTSREISLCNATTNFAHLASVLEPLLEKIESRDGVYALHLTARGIQAEQSRQADFIQGEKLDLDSAKAGEFINLLLSRLGRDKVHSVEFTQSYTPERSFAFSPIDKKQPKLTEEPQSFKRTQSDWPTILFPKPEPASVIAMLPDRAPSWIRWRNQGYKIAHGAGPEIIALEWWHKKLPEAEISSALSEREYFKVQEETGRWLWIFRERKNMTWFVHGMWS